MPPKKSNDDAEEIVLEYLNKQYRPYSTNDIFQNLHGEVGKAAVAKAVESLAAQGKITTKAFGKMSISVANMETGDVSEMIQSSQKEMDSINEQMEAMERDVTKIEETCTELGKYPDDETMEKQTEELKKTITMLKTTLEKAKNQVSMNENTIKRIKELQSLVNKETDKRSKLYKNFIKWLSEYIYPESLIKELGLEDPEH